jgi:hypothetical protein
MGIKLLPGQLYPVSYSFSGSLQSVFFLPLWPLVILFAILWPLWMHRADKKEAEQFHLPETPASEN